MFMETLHGSAAMLLSRELVLSLLGTVLRGVVDPKHFDAVLLYAVHRDIGKGLKQQLSGAVLASDAATVRPIL
jgi:hypothetical protein